MAKNERTVVAVQDGRVRIPAAMTRGADCVGATPRGKEILVTNLTNSSAYAYGKDQYGNVRINMPALREAGLHKARRVAIRTTKSGNLVISKA